MLEAVAAEKPVTAYKDPLFFLLNHAFSVAWYQIFCGLVPVAGLELTVPELYIAT